MQRFFERVMGVYFDDLDPFHILHNARYPVLFERVLGAFWLELGWGSFGDAGRPEQFHLVRRLEVDYLSPVRGTGKVRIRVYVQRLGRTSLSFAFEMLPLDHDKPYARGTRTIVHVDADGLTAQPWPRVFRESIEPWVGQDAPGSSEPPTRS